MIRKLLIVAAIIVVAFLLWGCNDPGPQPMDQKTIKVLRKIFNE